MNKVLFLLCVLFFVVSFTAYSHELAEEDAGMKVGGLIIMKANINPWLLSEGDENSIMRGMGLNGALELVSTLGPFGTSVGYQFMGIGGGIGDKNTNYGSPEDFILRAPIEHLISVSTLFAWHKGIFRPYVSIGATLTIRTRSIGTQDYGSIRYRIDEIANLEVGVLSQFGVDFYLIDNLGIGLGVDFLVQDARDFETHDYHGLLRRATYISTRMVIDF